MRLGARILRANGHRNVLTRSVGIAEAADNLDVGSRWENKSRHELGNRVVKVTAYLEPFHISKYRSGPGWRRDR